MLLKWYNKLGAHLNLIDLYYQQKKRDKALKTAEKAIDIFPLEPRLFIYAADVYKNKKDYNTAIKRLKAGVAMIIDAELESIFIQNWDIVTGNLARRKVLRHV